MIRRTMVNNFYVSGGYSYPKGWYRVLCPDGKRRYAEARTADPDTFFSHPAAVQVSVEGIKYKVSGFISHSDKTTGEGLKEGEGDILFTPVMTGINYTVFRGDGTVGHPDNSLITLFDEAMGEMDRAVEKMNQEIWEGVKQDVANMQG
jgi:hypothetical protein